MPAPYNRRDWQQTTARAVSRMGRGQRQGGFAGLRPVAGTNPVQQISSGDPADTIHVRESHEEDFTVTGTGTATFDLDFIPIDKSWNVSCGYPLDASEFDVTDQTLTITAPTTTFIGASVTYPKTLHIQYDYLAGRPAVPVDGLYVVWYQPEDWATGANGITQWNDTSGNDFHGTSSGANTPAVASAATPAGGDAADFTNPEYIQLPSGISTPLADGAEMFLVIKADASGGNGPHSIGGAAAYPSYGDASITDNFGSSTAHTFNPAATVTGWNVYHLRSVASDWKAYFNGVQVHSDATNTVAWTPGQLRIGRAGLAFFSDVFWEGQVAEVIITVPLTDDQRASIVASLESRHGL